jgi:hypothetical protein
METTVKKPTLEGALGRVRTDPDARLAAVLAAVFGYALGFVLGFVLGEREGTSGSVDPEA